MAQNNSCNFDNSGVTNSGYVLTTNGTKGAWAAASSGPSYSTGTWTPTIALGGSSSGITYASQYGQYTVIGNAVFINFNVQLSSTGGNTGIVTIESLPFESGPDGIWQMPLTLYSSSIAGFTGTYGQIDPSTSDMILFAYDATSGSSAECTNGNIGDSTEFIGTGFYQTS